MTLNRNDLGPKTPGTETTANRNDSGSYLPGSKRPGTKMTRDRNDPGPRRPGNRNDPGPKRPSSLPSLYDPTTTPILPTTTQPLLSYPPLPNHPTSSYLTPTSYCIILLLLPFPSPTPYTPTPTTNVLLPIHPYHHHTTPYSPPPILPYPYSPPALTFSIRSPLYTPITTTIHCLTLPSPPSLPCPTISHSVKPPAYS